MTLTTLLLSLMITAPVPQQVYAHLVPWFPPSHSRPDRAVDLAGHATGQVTAAAKAGIDGFTVDIVLKPPLSALGVMKGYLKAALAVPGFTISPCLDKGATTKPEEWLAFLKAWLDLSQDDPHRMQLDGKAVVFTYAGYGLDGAGWDVVRQGCREQGEELLILAEVNGLIRSKSKDEALPVLVDLAKSCDALYCFAPFVEGEQLIDEAYQQVGLKDRLRIYSPSPGYWRWTNMSFSRPYQGTATYLQTWQEARDVKADWVSLTTWNDYAEHTHVEPSRNVSDLFSRITAIEAAWFKSTAVEAAEGQPTWYLTSPAEMPDGPGGTELEGDLRRERIFAATRVGAPGDTVPVKVELILPDGQVLLTKTLSPSGDGPLGDDSFVWEPEQTLGVPWLNVTATSGKLHATVYLPLWPRNVSHAYTMAPLRTKLAADPPAAPKLSLRDGKLVVDPLEPPAPLRVDLLHNYVHMPDPKSRTGAVAVGAVQLPQEAPAWGFWSAATVTPEAVTSWSAPLWIAPPGDPSVLAQYRFEEGGHDESVYARKGRVHGPKDAWQATLADGSHALRSGPEVWFEPPGGFSPATAPFTVELWVRPDEPNGMLWGDVGAPLLLGLKDRHVQLTRHNEQPKAGWHSVVSKETMPLDEWSHVAGVYDRENLVLLLNGVEVGRVACPGSSASQRMGIGRNPFNASSPFTGLLDDFRMTARVLAPSEFGPVNPLRGKPAEPK